MAGPPPAAQPTAPAAAPGDGLLRLWYVRLPRAVESVAPRVAGALADGAWTAIWPRLAAFAPLVGVALGLAMGLLHPFLPSRIEGYPRAWSELLPFMMLVIAAGLVSGTVGVAILAGYVAGDLARFLLWLVTEFENLIYFGSLLPFIAGYLGSALISYLLLAIPAFTLPQVARDFAERAPVRRIASAGTRKIARAAVYVLAAGALTFFWTRAVVVLLRPVFTWRQNNPNVEAIYPVQFQWEWLVGTAVIAAIVGIVLRQLVMRRSPGAIRIAALQAQRWHGARPPGGFWRRMGPIPQIALFAGAATLLLAGTYEDFMDPILVFAIAVLAAAWRMGIIRPTTAWARTVERVPALGRLVIAGIVGYGMARIVLESMWAIDGGLRPVLIGILLILAVFLVLFPAQVAARPRRTVEPA